jgi:hypothetical protein
MEVDGEVRQRRARWRRDKRVQRSRTAQQPRTLPAQVVEAIMEERNRRAADSYAAQAWRSASYMKDGTQEKATGFVADVWAAQTLLTLQFGACNATPTRIARWLTAAGKDQGYAAGSLRVMVYRALERVRIAESTSWPSIWPGWTRWEAPEWFPM